MATAPVLARGINKTVVISAETTLATQAAGPGQALRRTGANINLNVQEIASQEILPSQQVRDSRQGSRGVQGTIAGQLTPATYKDLFQGLLRGTFTSGATATLSDGVITVSGTTGAITFTGTTTPDHFMTTNNLKVGDVFRWTNIPTAGDNGVNLRIASLTDTVVNVIANSAITASSAGAGETITVVGKKLTIPQTGQVQRSYTIEEWYADIGESILWLGNRITQMSINIPPSGFVMMQASLQGVSMAKSSSQVYVSPTPVTSTKGLTAVAGKVSYGGVDLGIITSMNIVVAADVSAPPIVGSQYVADVFVGTIQVTGSFTALLANDTMTADFLNEAEVQLAVLLTTDPSATADFIAITLPRVKLTAMTRTDGDKEISRSFNFRALEQSVLGGLGTAYDATSIVVQDSLA